MQLCALDQENNLVWASHATKHINYACVECGLKVRVRSGLHRKAHYYHIQPNQACTLHAKGMVHLMLQEHFKTILPAGEVELECRFPEIGRIADVAWLSRRLIFEIQCSPITAVEVQARNASYASIGFQVVWIFHDSRYNKYHLTAAEDFIQTAPHYYSDMTVEGVGGIYDQFSLIKQGCRLHRLPPMRINPQLPKKLHPEAWQEVPAIVSTILLNRVKTWSLGFAEDCLDRCLRSDEALIFEFTQLAHKNRQLEEGNLEFSSLSLREGIRIGFQRYLFQPYRALLRLLLERACR